MAMRLEGANRLRAGVAGSVAAVLLLGACAQVSPAANLSRLSPDQAAQAVAADPGLRALAATAVANDPALQATATAIAASRQGAPGPNATPGAAGAAGGQSGASGPAAASATPGPVAAALGRTATVRRGTIADDITLIGRVSGREEVPVAFTGRGTVGTLLVQPGQTVRAGQALAELDTKQVQRDLDAARARLDVSLARVDQTDRQAQARRQKSIADAEEAVRRAEADLQKVRAGASTSERQTAEGQVISARASVQKAQADLAKLKSAASPSAIKAAEQQVTLATLTAQSAEADLAKLKAGAAPTVVRKAERDVASAKVSQAAAQAELDRLQQGPDAFALRAAERELERAKGALKSAEAGKGGSPADAAIVVANAQDKLAQLKEPPRPEVLAAARIKVEDASIALAAAEEALAAARKGPSELDLAKATAAVDATRAALLDAQERLADLKAGPPADQVEAGTSALEAAQLQLAAAEARRDEVSSRPTADELREPQARLAQAQAALAAARAGTDGGDGGVDMTGLRKSVDDDRAAVQTAEAGLASSVLAAPFDGAVVAVQAQVGDTAGPDRAALVLARGQAPVVAVSLTGPDTTRVAAGQTASVQLDGVDGATVAGSVESVADAPGGRGRVAVVTVPWGTAQPNYGATARVTITPQKHDNALIVPQKALRTAGSRRYVEILDGGVLKTATVQVGITTRADVEILSGLDEGQVVILGQ